MKKISKVTPGLCGEGCHDGLVIFSIVCGRRWQDLATCNLEQRFSNLDALFTYLGNFYIYQAQVSLQINNIRNSRSGLGISIFKTDSKEIPVCDQVREHITRAVCLNMFFYYRPLEKKSFEIHVFFPHHPPSQEIWISQIYRIWVCVV